MAEFDPSQPFDIVDEAKGPKFDPSQPFELAHEASPLESAARGAAQAGSFGFADELTGGAEALWKKAHGDPKAFGELYRQERDASRNNYQAAQSQNPGSYLSGQVAGSVAPALLSGGTSVAGLAAQGALQGLGSSNADLTQGDYTGAARDTALGGVVGGVIGGLGKAAGAANEYFGSPLTRAADYLGGGLKSGAESLAKAATGAEGLSDDAGRTLLDQGMVKFGDTAKNIADRVAKSADSSLASDAEGAGIPARALDFFDGNASPSARMKAIDGANASLSGEEASSPLKDISSAISDASSKPGFGGAHSWGPSVTDAAAYIGAGPHGYVAKKVLEKVVAPRALSSSAVLADNLGDVLKATPQVFGKFAGPLQAAAARGGTALAATNFVLQQTNPEYRNLVLGKDNEDEGH